MTELPIVEDFGVPSLGLILRDERNVDRADQIIASDVYQETLGDLIQEYASRSLEFCDMRNPEHVDRLRQEDILADPSVAALNGDEYEASIGDRVVIDESDCDPRLSVVSFVAIGSGPQNAGEIFGIFTLYNIRLESEMAGVLTINCMTVPGIKPVRNRTLEAMWTDVMRRLLLQNIDTEDGREIDLVEWRFPDREAQNWGGNELLGSGFSANRVVDRVAVGQDLTKVGNVPISIRRR